MKRVLLRSVYDAFDYVMEHYAPSGLEELASRQDTYAVISIQDTHSGGFGFQFQKSRYCVDVLTLYFDDVTGPVEGAVAFTREMAAEILAFLRKNRRRAETLLVHCYGGESRSRAVAAFAVKMFGGEDSRYFETGRPNMLVYETLTQALERGRDREP